MECRNYEKEAFSNSHEMQYGAIKQKKLKKNFRFLWISQECYILLPTRI